MNGEKNPIIPGPVPQDPGEPFNLQLSYDKIVQLHDARSAAAKQGDLPLARKLDAEIRQLDDAIERAVHPPHRAAPPVPQPRPPEKGEERELQKRLAAIQRKAQAFEAKKRQLLRAQAESPAPDFSEAQAVELRIQAVAHEAGNLRARLDEIDRWNVRQHQMRRQDESMAAYRRAEEKRKQARIELRRRVDELLPTIDAIKQLAAEAQDGQEIGRLLAALGGR